MIAHTVDVHIPTIPHIPTIFGINVNLIVQYGIRIFFVIVVVIITVLLNKGIHKFTTGLFKRFSNDMDDLKMIVNFSFRTLLWLVALFLSLEILQLGGFVTHVLASVGIVGVIVGFAFKDIASNAFAGFLIRANRPFKVGDWVKIEGYIGTITNMGFITTGIKTFAGELAVIPNQQIYNSAFLNYSHFGTMRIIIQMGVSYGDYLANVEQLAVNTIRTLPMVLDKNTVDFYFISVGSSTYNFEVRYWIKYNERKDMLKATNAGIQALKETFDKNNVCVAYNVTTLDFGGKGGVNLDQTSLEIINKTAKEN